MVVSRSVGSGRFCSRGDGVPFWRFLSRGAQEIKGEAADFYALMQASSFETNVKSASLRLFIQPRKPLIAQEKKMMKM